MSVRANLVVKGMTCGQWSIIDKILDVTAEACLCIIEAIYISHIQYGETHQLHDYVHVHRLHWSWMSGGHHLLHTHRHHENTEGPSCAIFFYRPLEMNLSRRIASHNMHSVCIYFICLFVCFLNSQQWKTIFYETRWINPTSVMYFHTVMNDAYLPFVHKQASPGT